MHKCLFLKFKLWPALAIVLTLAWLGTHLTLYRSVWKGRGQQSEMRKPQGNFFSVVRATRPRTQGEREWKGESGRVGANAAGQKSTTYNPPGRVREREGESERGAGNNFVSDDSQR